MQIKETIHQILNQLSSILTQLNDDEYTKELLILNNQTIGKHTRHILEFFQAIVYSEHYICYDERKRDSGLETSVTYTLNCISEVKNNFFNINPHQSIQFKQLIGDTFVETKSSIEREIIYCIDHSIHHFAIIKIALKDSFHHVTINEDFGIAYSTINYHKK